MTKSRKQDNIHILILQKHNDVVLSRFANVIKDKQGKHEKIAASLPLPLCVK